MHSPDALKGFVRAAIFTLAVMAPGLVGSVGATALTHLDVGVQAPAFSAQGADGQRHRLSDYAGKLVVLEWTNPVCPFTAARYKSGAMQALQQYAAARQVVWLSIDTAAPDRAGYLTAGQARARIAQTGAQVSEFLFDVDGSIARHYGAKVTPSFFIVDRQGKLAYQGAMDDQLFGDPGQGREYMKSALADLVAGRPVKDVDTQAQGCAIEY